MKATHALKIVLKDTIMSREREYLEEAIKELEDLENRSCDGCIHIFKSNNLECSTCLRNYTDRWESRDEVL